MEEDSRLPYMWSGNIQIQLQFHYSNKNDRQTARAEKSLLLILAKVTDDFFCSIIPEIRGVKFGASGSCFSL